MTLLDLFELHVGGGGEDDNFIRSHLYLFEGKIKYASSRSTYPVVLSPAPYLCQW